MANCNESICRSCFHSYVCEQFNENKNIKNNKCHFFNDHFAPTSDVVEVVRCKDCKKRYTKNCSLCYDTANKGYFLWSMINDNFFCAYGERKCDNNA